MDTSSTFQRGASPTLSMREKSLLKRRINREHNSNFRAGYVNINEEQLHKTGIRGRKRYVVYVIIVLLAITVIVNILLTGTIMAVLGIGMGGMGSLEFVPCSVLLRFLRDSYMGDVRITDSQFGSLPEQPLELSASHGGRVQLKVTGKESSSFVSVEAEKTILQSDQVDITDPVTGDKVFSTNQENFRFPQQARTIDTPQVITDRVTSGTKERLAISSPKKAILAGYEGVSFGGRSVSIKGKDLSFYTPDDLVLDGAEGTRINFYRGLPIKNSSQPLRTDINTLKLCIDASDGQIFSVSWDQACPVKP